MHRRIFLQSLAALPSMLARAGNPSGSITEIALDLKNIHKWDNSNGDTWDPFWANDDNLYAFNCDGRGFGTQPRNLAFNRLQGDSPDTLVGSLINSMDEYGKAGKKEADNATWKACGQECIDSVFYAFVSRNTYGSDSGDPLLRQTAANSSLIKSTDRGKTWTRSAAENYANPMWPGQRFGAPFFIHYGKNGGSVTRDGADRYVYATSTNGFWNDGDYYILGRIERSKLPELKASDWTYYRGGDGENNHSWSQHILEAKPILQRPAKCGQGPACFIPALNTYLMISWYNTAKMTKWFEPNEMRYDFFQTGHPWAPWSFICSHSDDFLGSAKGVDTRRQTEKKFAKPSGGALDTATVLRDFLNSKRHMYGPSLCAKFQEPQNSTVKMSLFTSGCPFEDRPTGFYKIWRIPIVLKTSAS